MLGRSSRKWVFLVVAFSLAEIFSYSRVVKMIVVVLPLDIGLMATRKQRTAVRSWMVAAPRPFPAILQTSFQGVPPSLSSGRPQGVKMAHPARQRPCLTMRRWVLPKVSE